jgi:two-component system NtrC family sensor kinase
VLRNRLFAAFVALVLLIGTLSAVFGIRIIQHQVIDAAQKRVRLDLASAWTMLGSTRRDLEITLRLVADSPTLVEAALRGDWTRPALKTRLVGLTEGYALDFVGLADATGVVRVRADTSRPIGDSRAANPAIRSALQGEARFGILQLGREDLDREGRFLADRAALTVLPTPHARASDRQREERGLILMGATPVFDGTRQLGVLYGGILLNRNTALVDQIRDLVYREMYQGRPVGAATIFLDDTRISTTVLNEAGERAVGTRASAEVADRVLRDGISWIGRAFVVRDWYLTAYDPLKDLEGRTVGMLYVGILEKPFNALRRSYTAQYAGLLLFGVLLALTLAFWIALRLARPIHTLTQAAGQMATEPRKIALRENGGCREIDRLISAFNAMAVALEERDQRILSSRLALEESNRSLAALNRSYLDLLGFVSHELKVPVSSVNNYLHLLSTGALGAVEDRQRKALQAMTRNVEWMIEMVRHYLSLSRIESGEIQSSPAVVHVVPDILHPVLEALQGTIEARGMRLDLDLPEALAVKADPLMTREIFENLLSNALKYGCEGGRIAVSAREAPTAPGWIEFTVGNEGEGIPADRMDDLFLKFSPLHAQTRTRKRGTGLGLYITRHHVEANGGRITARSEPGRWIEFRFTLPAAQVNEPGPPTPPASGRNPGESQASDAGASGISNRNSAHSPSRESA